MMLSRFTRRLPFAGRPAVSAFSPSMSLTRNFAGVNTDIPPTKYVEFENEIVMIGFGSIGEGTLPLILKHIDLEPDQITIITAPDRAEAAFAAKKKYGVNVQVTPLTEENYEEILDELIDEGDFVCNVSVDCDSPAIMEYCNEVGALYIDTVVDAWKDVYLDSTLEVNERSNYDLREEALEMAEEWGEDAPTALIAHGANPGMVSHFVKRGLLNMAKDRGIEVDPEPEDGYKWACLARDLGVTTIHISERDTQICNKPKRKGEFVNTWSVSGLIYEGQQPAELGWGTHEKKLPEDAGLHEWGSRCAIYLNTPGLDTQVRTWTPNEGPFRGWLVTHNEAMSIAHFLTIDKEDEPDEEWLKERENYDLEEDDVEVPVVYRPTVHYAYHPCNDAVLSIHELNGLVGKPQENHRLIVDDITEGVDELGVLFGGKDMKTYWYGSQLSVDDAKKMIEKNSPTTLQVTAAVCAGMIWCIENPECGVVEAEDIDTDRILEIMQPYVEPVVGVYTDWNPLYNRSELFGEDVDWEDPWQFSNVRCNMRTPITTRPLECVRIKAEAQAKEEAE